MATYPGGVASFTPVVDGVDYPQADDVNGLYDETTAVEQGLLDGLGHDLKFSPDASYDLGKPLATRPRDGHFSRNVAIGGTLVVTGATNLGAGLSVGANATVVGSLTVTGGINGSLAGVPTVTVGVGTVALPSIAVGDSDVGLYSSGTNALDVTTNGVKALGISANQFIDSPTQPRCVAWNTAGQNVASTTAVLTLNSEDVDVGDMHSTSVNTSRLTVPAGGGGLYLINGHTVVSLNGSDTVLNLRKNGSNIGYADYSSVTGGTVGMSITAFLVLAAADYIELAGTGTAGTPTFGSATRQYATQLQMVKLW